MFGLGPEPTMIGAKPLISFGDTKPLTALVGEQPQQPSPARSDVAVPHATFLAPEPVPFFKNKSVWFVAAVLALAAIVIVIAVAL